MSAALDTTLDDILEVTSGSADAPPVCYRQTAAMAVQQGQSWRFTKRGQWQNALAAERPISYGLRNSRVVAGMRELASKLPIEFVDEQSRVRLAPAQLQRGTASPARQRHHRAHTDRR